MCENLDWYADAVLASETVTRPWYSFIPYLERTIGVRALSGQFTISRACRLVPDDKEKMLK